MPYVKQYFCFAGGELRHKGMKKLIGGEVKEAVSKLHPFSPLQTCLLSTLSQGSFSDSLIGYHDSTFWILKYLYI